MAIKAPTCVSPAEAAAGAFPKVHAIQVHAISHEASVCVCRRAPYDQFFLPELQRHQQEQGEAPEEGQQPGTLRPAM
jgi:hypothetical protein